MANKSNPVVHLQQNNTPSPNHGQTNEHGYHQYIINSSFNPDEDIIIPEFDTNFKFKISIAPNKYSVPVNSNPEISTLELFAELLFNASKVVEDKSDNMVLCPSTYIDKAPSKESIYLKDRYITALDIDEDCDINTIQGIFKNYCSIIYTTHSHLVNNVRKYRVIIIHNHVCDYTEWETIYHPRFIQWAMDIETQHGVKIDTSCFKFGQIAYFPSINPKLGYCELWAKEGLPFNLDSLPTANQSAITTAMNNTEPSTMTTVDVKKLVKILKGKNELVGIKSKEGGKINRLKIAASLHFFGITYPQFIEIDRIMYRGTGSMPIGDPWKITQSWNHYPNTILGLLSKNERCTIGLETDSRLKGWDTVHWLLKDEYMSRKLIGNKYMTLVYADMGTGKNRMWGEYDEDNNVGHQNLKGDKVVMFTSYRSVVFQNNSNNKVDKSDNRVFTYDQADNFDESIITKGINTEDYILVGDEIHTMKTADYRAKALQRLYNLITKHKWKQVILQSATIDHDTFDDIFKFDNKVAIKRCYGPTLNYTQISTSRFEQAICEIISKPEYKDSMFVVLFNRIDGLKFIQGELEKKGINSELVTAELMRQEGTFAYELANNGNFESNVKVILGTSSIGEGVNIMNKVKNVHVIVAGYEPKEALKQICGRLRLAETINLWHIAIWNEKFKHKSPYNDMKYLEELKKAVAVVSSTNSLIKFNNYKNSMEVNIVWDNGQGGYKLCDVAKLFFNNSRDITEFYSDAKKAQGIMRKMGFNIKPIPEGMKIVDPKKVDMYKGLIKDYMEGEKLNRAKSCALILDVLDKNVGLQLCGNEFENDIFDMMIINQIELNKYAMLIVELVKLKLDNGRKVENVIEEIKWVIKNKNLVSVDRLFEKTLIGLERADIPNEETKGLKTGDIVDGGMVKEIIERVLNKEMVIIRDTFGCTPTDAFTVIKAIECYSRMVETKTLTLENGKVVCNSEYSVKTINALGWIKTKKGKAWIDGVRKTVSIIT